MVVRLTRCVRELREGYSQAPPCGRAHSIKNGVDRSATTAGHLIDEAAAALRELDANRAPICLLRVTRAQTLVREAIAGLDLAQPRHLYFAGIAASQFISNVPAAIALAEYSDHWRVIAFGVAVGGFGFVIGSLANLIALRMTDDRHAWISFHAYSLLFLAAAALSGYAVLFWRPI